MAAENFQRGIALSVWPLTRGWGSWVLCSPGPCGAQAASLWPVGLLGALSLPGDHRRVASLRCGGFWELVFIPGQLWAQGRVDKELICSLSVFEQHPACVWSPAPTL